MKRYVWILLGLLALLFVSSALGETSITFTPEQPRLGDYVDVIVTPGRDQPESIAWALLCDGEEIFSGKPETHLTASFRPRREGTYTLSVTLGYGKKDTETAEISVPVSGIAPAQESREVLYSQKDGWWADKVYSKKHKRSVQKSGCALFALSHALQRMGISDPSVIPDALAATYSRFYINERGTDNEGLIRQASLDYDFVTQNDLIESEKEIATCLKRGDLFSFSIVIGHIALADGLSEDGTKVHIVDSAASATYERINKYKIKGHIYYRAEDGTFIEAVNPEDLPGIRWFFETGEYSGMEYWMDLSYCAWRGMRLIRSPWLKANLGDGLKGVIPEYAGALITKVVRDENAVRVPTRDLRLGNAEAGAPQIALITAKKGTRLLDGNGKALSGAKRIPYGSMVLLLENDRDLLYAWWDGSFGFLARKDTELLSSMEDFETGLISVNGKTSGSVEVTVHMNPKADSKKTTAWKPGTPVAVADRQGEFLLLEGKGIRGWVHEKYYTPDTGKPSTED